MTYEELQKTNLILFHGVRGSQLYGLSTPESDLDTYQVFCAPQNWVYGTGRDYLPFLADEKQNNTSSELGKYIKELGKSNPDALISLWTPPELIISKSPLLEPLWEIRDSLLTKECFKSFRGYARSQIGKAKGLQKAMNIDPGEVKNRKTPLEFSWVHIPGTEGVWTLEKWLRENGLTQEHCGLVRLPNGIEYYCLFYDWGADKNLSPENYLRLRYKSTPETFRERIISKETGNLIDLSGIYQELEDLKKTGKIKFRGILDTGDPNSSQLRLSSISKKDSREPLISFQYNMNAFSSHCRKYKEYWEWVAHRNPDRYKENLGHSYDAKNCSHCIRLLRMASEIATGQGVILDRREAGDSDFLLAVKKHLYSEKEVMEMIKEDEKKMEESFESSVLPDFPNLDLLEEIMINIRKNFYENNK